MNEGADTQRSQMVQNQIAARGVKDEHVLKAMRSVPRHLFVPKEDAKDAYRDSPLPIGEGQTISQPYIVALMVEACKLKPTSRVLEIGTGSGYCAAVMGQIAQNIVTIERIDTLAAEAKKRLANLGYQNIECLVGDGTLGVPEKGPYDAIIVTAGAPAIPEALKQQLAINGLLIIPVGDSFSQYLTIVQKIDDNEFVERRTDAVRFVPLIGEQGW